MTKADLIEEVSHAVQMPRKDSEVIVETILESFVKACGWLTKSRFAVSAVSVRVRGSREWAATPEPALASKCRPKKVPHFKASKEVKDLVNGCTIVKQQQRET